MTFIAKCAVAAVAALAIFMQPGAAVAQAKRQTIRMNDGLIFPYMRLIRFWDASDDTLAGDTPNEQAPGLIQRVPGVIIHNNVPKAEAAVIERRLKVALEVLLDQTPLRNIHGSDIRTGIVISRGPGGRPQGKLSISSFPINLSNPKTKAVDGRYSTPGEGAFLEIYYNAPLHDQAWDRVVIAGEYDGIKIQSLLASYAGIITRTDRTFLVPGQNGEVFNPDYFDPSRPATDLQLLWFYPSSGYSDSYKATKWSSRLAAAAYMVDWNDIVRRMEQVR